MAILLRITAEKYDRYSRPVVSRIEIVDGCSRSLSRVSISPTDVSSKHRTKNLCPILAAFAFQNSILDSTTPPKSWLALSSGSSSTVCFQISTQLTRPESGLYRRTISTWYKLCHCCTPPIVDKGCPINRHFAARDTLPSAFKPKCESSRIYPHSFAYLFSSFRSTKSLRRYSFSREIVEI